MTSPTRTPSTPSSTGSWVPSRRSFIRAHLSRLDVTSKNRSFEHTYYSAEDLPGYGNEPAVRPPPED